jgi:hypothetical protein
MISSRAAAVYRGDFPSMSGLSPSLSNTGYDRAQPTRELASGTLRRLISVPDKAGHYQEAVRAAERLLSVAVASVRPAWPSTRGGEIVDQSLAWKEEISAAPGRHEGWHRREADRASSGRDREATGASIDVAE